MQHVAQKLTDHEHDDSGEPDHRGVHAPELAPRHLLEIAAEEYALPARYTTRPISMPMPAAPNPQCQPTVSPSVPHTSGAAITDPLMPM